MVKQDEYCSNAEAGRWAELEGKEYPEDLKLEALVDVLRGKVKVHVHCYETGELNLCSHCELHCSSYIVTIVDLDGIIRVSSP